MSNLYGVARISTRKTKYRETSSQHFIKIPKCKDYKGNIHRDKTRRQKRF